MSVQSREGCDVLYPGVIVRGIEMKWGLRWRVEKTRGLSSRLVVGNPGSVRGRIGVSLCAEQLRFQCIVLVKIKGSMDF